MLGERPYAYAKACGIIGRSFIGKRLSRLEKASRLSELDRMIFPDASRDLPEKELLVDLEERIISRAASSINAIVDSFSKPPQFLRLLVQSEESLKEELGDEKQGDASMQSALMDQRYYKALWKALFALPRKDRQATEKILADEISLKNSSWALRLRTYYHLPPDKVKPYLIDIARGNKRPSLAYEAIQSLDFPLDSISAWSSWRWKDFLNEASGHMHWHAEPRHFQNAASRHLYRLARHHFHLSPFSLDSIFCFIKLKEFEEDILISSAEGLSIGMSSSEIFSMLGVEA